MNFGRAFMDSASMGQVVYSYIFFSLYLTRRTHCFHGKYVKEIILFNCLILAAYI